MIAGLSPVSHLEFMLRIATAFLLGSVVGIERQWRQRNAGLRTNALVATGTALFTMITPLIGAPGNVYQIASYVVSGIGFLAGGVIFKEGLTVRGLNTAATLWCTAAVGALAGFGFIFEATIGVLTILIANVALRPVARFVNASPNGDAEIVTSYIVRITCAKNFEAQVHVLLMQLLKSAHLPLNATSLRNSETGDMSEIIAELSAVGRAQVRLERIAAQLAAHVGVTALSWSAVQTTDQATAELQET